jgi:outer membrane immunogenic protein
MRRLLAATLVLGAVAAPAMAADISPAPIPAPAPVYPKAPVMMMPAYDWTGFYVGGHVAYSWVHTNSTTTDTVAGTVFAPATEDNSHFHGGGQIGFDYMMPSRIVFGVVADISSGSSNTTTTSNAAGTVIETNASKTDVVGTVRGRLGYAFDTFLLYGTGGWLWNSGSRTRTQVAGTINAATAGTVETLNTHNTGWVVGAGLDYAFARNWDVFAEYRYASLQAITVAFPLAGRSTNSTSNSSTIEAGLNYRFNWGGSVAARY